MHTRIRVIAAALVGIAISVMVGGIGLAKDKPCKNVHGRLISQQVMGTACASPVGLCTAGNFFGGIKGTFTFTANTLTPTTDTPQTGVFTYTGDIAVSTKDGTLSLKDCGAFNVTPGSTGDVGDVSDIVAATGALTGSSGYIHISGTFTTADGGDSDYEGQVCTP